MLDATCPPRPASICTVEACDKPVTCRKLCQKHYTRLLRHGDPEAFWPGRRERVDHSHGYILVYAPEHPLANPGGRKAKGGRVFEHRLVLFDSIGPGPHPCHWCSRPVHWSPGEGELPLATDHLDTDRQNNVPANLVPSCFACNTGRGVPYTEFKDGTPRIKVRA